MKQYTDEEIVDYARLRIRQQKDQRFLLWFMVVGGVVGIVSLVTGVLQKVQQNWRQFI